MPSALWVLSDVVLSGSRNDETAFAMHGSAATPLSWPPATLTHPAATQPPKYSTVDAAPRSAASVGTCFVAPGGTEKVVAFEGPFSPKPDTRTSTGTSPGFAIESVTVQPSPPPCGQYHRPEGAWPCEIDPRAARGPIWSSVTPAAITTPTTTSARNHRLRAR